MSCNLTATMNRYLKQKQERDGDERLGFIYSGMNTASIGERIADAMKERRDIINDLNIGIGDVINVNGKKNIVIGFTRDFLLKFKKGDRIDPRTILILEFKIIKKI